MSGSSSLAGAFVFLLVGVAVTGGGWYLYEDARYATENAVEVDATVVSSEVTEEREDDDDDGDYDTVYSPRVQYRYTYEGETYTNGDICPGAGSGCGAAQDRETRQRAQEFLADYEEGETVTVYVLPNEPSRSYLVDRDSPSNTYFIMMGIGGLFAVLGLYAVVSNVADLLD